MKRDGLIHASRFSLHASRFSHMFKTLSSKLIFSYIAVAAFCLLMALGVTFALGRIGNDRLAYQSLKEKSALAIPFVSMEMIDQRRPAPQALLNTFRQSVQMSGLRVLFVDPTTMKVVEDSALRNSITGEQIDLGNLTGKQDALSDPKTGITGKVRLPREAITYLYFARAIKPSQVNASRTTGLIVVFAQRQRNLPELAGQLMDFMWPAALVALLLSLGMGYLLARSISRPVARLTEGATAMSQGDYTRRIPVEGHDELATLTERFNHMAEEVGRAHQMERDFVANVSHDLKTPLTSIQGFSQAMLDGAIVEPQGYREAAAIINSEAQRMDRLVSELLQLSRLQNGLNTLEMRATNLGELLAQVTLAMQPQAASAGVELLLHKIGPDVNVLADSDRLKQAFGNLLDNAIRHTPLGGTVTIELTATTSQTEIAVHDSGQGIPPEDLDRVMERFYQVDKSRSTSDHKNAGLGLAIAREIVRAHHGDIQIESRQGEGTTVRVMLPTSQAQIREPTRRSALKLPHQNRHPESSKESNAKA